jgi:serine/threonine protein kinase
MAFLLKDYKDIQELARGGMGKVYLATQVSLNRKVIIKEMATGLLTNVSEIKRFENEARAAALLNHDNVIRIYDFGEDRGSFYISMEYVDGPDLETILKDKYCTPEIALMIVLHALKGLNFAHQHQIIHRDIKPGNILVSNVGAVKVVDFGLAHAGAQQVHLTATDMIVGTPLYMSPEQASGEERKNIQMDVWSVGVLLYRIITGDYPFKGDNVPAILFSIVQTKQPPMQEKSPALPDGLAHIINLCLEKNREQRLANLTPLIESLQNYFFEIGIKDTAEQTRKYISDPASCLKELSGLLLNFHGQKSAEFEAAGDMQKARAHLVEAKKFDPSYKPIAKAIDALKKHTSSSIIKKSAPVTVTTGYTSWQPPSGAKNIKRFVIAAVVLALVIAGGGGVYYLSKKRTDVQPAPIAAVVPEVKPVPAAPPPVDSAALSQNSVKGADSTKASDTAQVTATVPAPVPQTAPAAPAVKKANVMRPVKKTVAALPTIAPPKTNEPERPQTAAVSTGLLKISINPPSAEVTVDGTVLSLREMGEGKRLKTGTHQLVAKATGYDIYSRMVTMEKDAVLIISADLVSQGKGISTLHVYSYPSAEIYIDGVFQALSPTAKPLTLAQGTHALKLKRAGYKTYEETITIAKEELKRVKVQLTKE